MAAVRRRSERDVAEENGATTPVKRRKLVEEEVDVVESRIILSPCLQATNRGGIVARNSAGALETSVVIVRRRDSPVEEQCQILIPISENYLNHRSYSVSCSSSNNRSDEKSKRKIEFVDFEENNGDDQSVTSWIYDLRSDPSYSEESVVMEKQESEDVESRRRLRIQKKKKKKKRSCETMKETEIEDFFQTTEKDLRNKMLECSMKYNFDFEKDEPLGGRYEWVKLNP